MQPEFYLATFESTHNALLFEKTLKSVGLSITVIPVPREITATCGLAVRFDAASAEDVKKITTEKNLSVADFYYMVKENNKKQYYKSV